MKIIIFSCAFASSDVSAFFIAITLKAELDCRLRLKVNLTGYWLVLQYSESHVARSVDQTSLPLCLFKLNTYSHRQHSQKLIYLRNYINVAIKVKD